MKKPNSISDAALAVIRVCLVLGIFISLFNFYIHSKQDSRIVIRIPPAETVAETQEYATEPDEPAKRDELISSTQPTRPTQPTQPTQPAETVAISGMNAETSVPAIQENGDNIVPDKAEDITEITSAAAAETEVYVNSAAASPYAVSETSSAAASNSGLININEAPESELVRLNGIGEVKAAAIVEYRRNNGKFRRIEDILNVSGIGEKTFEKIRDQITV